MFAKIRDSVKNIKKLNYILLDVVYQFFHL